MGMHGVPGIGVTGVTGTPGDPNTPYPFETWTPMHLAAAEGDSWAIQRLLGAGGRPDVQHGSSVMPCHTPLHVAARYGSIAVIKKILSVQRDPSPKDTHGLTPLHYAAFNGHTTACAELLRAGAGKPRKLVDDSFHKGEDVAKYSLFITLTDPSIKSPGGCDAITAAEGGEANRILIDKLKSWVKQTEESAPLMEWLKSLGCAESFSSFISAGYDNLHFIVSVGLSAENLNCIGVPMSQLGLRHKLTALHNAKLFLGHEQNSEYDEAKYELSPDTESSSE